MSIKIMTLVWDNFKRGGSEKLTMLALADWCNDEGGSLYPSIHSIAEKINTSDSRARRIVHKFIDEGYLTVIANHNGGNPGQSRNYKLNVKMLETPCANATPCMDATPSVDAHDPLHRRALPLAPTPDEPSLSVNDPSVGASEENHSDATSPSVINKRRKEDWQKPEDNPPAKPEEPKKAKGSRKSSPLTEIPDPFEITDQMFEFAESHGLSYEETLFQTKRFKNHHLTKGTKGKRWDLAWENWITGRFLKQGGSR